jgi:pyrroline-5-carboxylate reductase
MSETHLPTSLVLVGCGKMGGAMLEGWLAMGLSPATITVIDPLPAQWLKDRAAEAGFSLNPASVSASPAEVLVLGIKPQMLDAAAPSLRPYAGRETLVLSILAGKTMADLASRLPEARAFVRAMPNLPASVGRGMTGAFASQSVSTAQKAVADTLLSGVGRVEWIAHEGLIDAVTAVSGSGPAYVFHLVECLARAGVAEGLPQDVAERLARGTIEGAGELLFRSPLPPATLRQNVTSPGGTTAAALDVLMAETGLDPLIRKAVAAARRRAEELSG